MTLTYLTVKMDIGFIGLGNMGKPMAANVIKAGFSVTVTSFFGNEVPAAELQSMGAAVVPTIKELAAICNVIITILPADKQIIEVYTAADGIIDNAQDGAICIEMTSARGETVKRVSEVALERGRQITVVDAPVSGGVPGAQNGTLTIMVGGDKSTIEECRPILEAMGSKIFYTGDIGSGKSIKMINQFLNAGNTYIASEALYLAKSLGLDMELLYNVVNESSGGSWIFKNNVPKFILTENFEQGFRLDLMKKDLGLAIEQAHKDHVSLPIMNLIYQIYEAMSNQGHDSKNYNIISQWIKQQNK